MFDLVLVLVLVLTLVQGPTLPAAARLLKVTDTMYARQVVLEAVALEEVGAEVLQVSVAKGSRLAGLEIVELRLPKGSVVALLVRDGERQVPTRFSRIRAGDSLLVVTPASQRRAVEARLAAVSERGRLAGWT
jgi:cell volume regulation protein A